MAVFGTKNISLNAVRAALGETSKSLRDICRSPKINKWSRYSPLTNGGNYIPFETYPVSNPFDVSQWEHTKRAITEAKLGDFRNYKHDALPPATIMFPTELYKDLAWNQFVVNFEKETAYTEGICLDKVIDISNLYLGVAIRKKGSNGYHWATTEVKGGNIVSLNLTNVNYFDVNDIVECTVFFTPTKKNIDNPDVLTDFYSLKCDINTIITKEYTIKRQQAGNTYESVTINTEPETPFLDYDMVQFDNIRVTVKGKITAQYRYSVRIITPDESAFADYNMQSDVEVRGGETKTILNTGMFTFNFWQPQTHIFIQVYDLKDSGRLISEIIVQ